MRIRLGSAAAVLLLCAVACGRTSAEDVDAGVVDAGLGDAGLMCPTLWPVGATSARVTRDEFFGYVQECPADGGSIRDTTYVLDLVRGELRWAVCRLTESRDGGQAERRLFEGVLTLTSQQRDSFENAMRELRCVSRESYGADFESVYISLAVDGGTLRYQQQGNFPREDAIYVLRPGIQKVIDALDDIAGIP